MEHPSSFTIKRGCEYATLKNISSEVSKESEEISMKTIKEYFKNCDADALIRHYIYTHPITIKGENDEKYKYTFKKLYKKIDELIERIKNTEPAERTDLEKMVFIVYHSADIFDEPDINCGLFEIEEINKLCEKDHWFKESLKKSMETVDERALAMNGGFFELTQPVSKDPYDRPGFAETYSYIFTPFEEAIGFYVSDSPLTQYYIDDVLMSFIFEISFFGFEQEEQQEHRDMLTQGLEEAEIPEKTIPLEDLMNELKEEYGFTEEPRDDNEEKRYKELLYHIAEYNYAGKTSELYRHFKIEKEKENRK